MIRCWQESNASVHEPHWRFSMEKILHERQRWGFQDLEALIAFLRSELEEAL